MNFRKSRELQKKSHSLIPGGCHTYAKGDDEVTIWFDISPFYPDKWLKMIEEKLKGPLPEEEQTDVDKC